MTPCPYHSTLANGMRLYGPRHACFTAYDTSDREEARDE